MNYVFDTNIVLFYIRDEKTKQKIESIYTPSAPENRVIISIATVAEIRSIGLQNKWGTRRLSLVEQLMKKFIIIDIRYEPLLEAYAQIDAYSQGRLKDRPLNMSARNMGKNDLWIAATTSLTQSKLITTDADFKHLDGEFFDVVLIER